MERIISISDNIPFTNSNHPIMFLRIEIVRLEEDQ